MLDEKQIDTFVELYNKELPYAVIANRLGVSRSSISGYADRLRKLGRIKSLKVTKKEQAKRVVRNKEFGSNSYNAIVLHRIGKAKSPDVVVPWDYEPLGVPVTLLGLTNHTCRWPCTGDVYCGADVHKGGYCNAHYKNSLGEKK